MTPSIDPGDRACLHLDTEIRSAETTDHQLVNVLELDAVIGTVLRVLVDLEVRCRGCGRVEAVSAELDLFPPFTDQETP